MLAKLVYDESLERSEEQIEKPRNRMKTWGGMLALPGEITVAPPPCEVLTCLYMMGC